MSVVREMETGDPGEVLVVTTIVLFSGHFEEMSAPAVTFREDSLGTWPFYFFKFFFVKFLLGYS